MVLVLYVKEVSDFLCVCISFVCATGHMQGHMLYLH